MSGWLEFAFSELVEAGLTEVRRMIGVGRLAPGSYWLEVRLNAPDGLHAVRAAPLHLR